MSGGAALALAAIGLGLVWVVILARLADRAQEDQAASDRRILKEMSRHE